MHKVKLVVFSRLGRHDVIQLEFEIRWHLVGLCRRETYIDDFGVRVCVVVGINYAVALPMGPRLILRRQ